MNLKTTTAFFVLIIVMFQNLFGQQDQEAFQFLKSNIGEVKVKDAPHKQTIEQESNSCMLKISINNVEDQEKTTYQFNAADINPYKVSFETSRRNVLVIAETKGAKDLIRVTENGEIQGYDNELEFLAKDVENGRSLSENFKIVVENCQEKEGDVGFVLGNNPSLNEAIKYAELNVKKLKVNDNFLNQELKVNEGFKAVVDITITNEIENETSKYIFNMSDINPPTIDFDTKKEFVFVEGVTKGERALIEVYEDGEKSNYDNTFSVYVEGIEEARKLRAVLKYYAEASEDISNAELDKIEGLNTLGQLTSHLNTKVVDVIIEEDNYKQTLEADKANPFLVKYVQEYVNDGELDEYFFNLSDIDENSIHFDTRRNEVNVIFNTNGNKAIIQHKNNNELENYEDELSIRSSNIESARVLVETLKKSVEKAKEQYKPEFLSGNPNPSKAQVISFIKSAMQEVVIRDDAYKQSIETDADNNCVLLYEIHDVSKGEVLVHKFNLKDINVYKISFETRREEVFVHLETKGNDDLIEIIEEGETDGFDNEVNILTTGIEEARALQLAFKAVTEFCDEE